MQVKTRFTRTLARSEWEVGIVYQKFPPQQPSKRFNITTIPETQVKRRLARELSKSDWEPIIELWEATWPDSEPAHGVRIELEMELATGTDNSSCRRWLLHYIESDGNLAAVASSFGVTLKAGGEDLEVLAIAGVCCRESERGKGYGKALALDAFKRVNSGEFAVCLFQTAVPEFYEKLNCRRISNSIVNSTSDGVAFIDDYSMIYPAAYDLTEGEIDLMRCGW
ncbi:MAG: GNAT family N-acetyltransferase [Planctomycetes bacterium]|nr:GNAT family N-acetyltransferase [Planctomycetota bacterium]